eukprot:347286-Prymnesium_polylepis.2
MGHALQVQGTGSYGLLSPRPGPLQTRLSLPRCNVCDPQHGPEQRARLRGVHEARQVADAEPPQAVGKRLVRRHPQRRQQQQLARGVEPQH